MLEIGNWKLEIWVKEHLEQSPKKKKMKREPVENRALFAWSYSDKNNYMQITASL